MCVYILYNSFNDISICIRNLQKLISKNSENSQENTCESFLVKNELLWVFKIFRTISFSEHHNAEAYLGTCEMPLMKNIAKLSYRLIIANYFCRKLHHKLLKGS